MLNKSQLIFILNSFFFFFFLKDLIRYPFLDIWPNQRRQGRSALSFGKVVGNTVLCEFHSSEICREVSHCELFPKIQSLLFALRIAFLQSLPMIHDHT